jgi:hypothetical protein
MDAGDCAHATSTEHIRQLENCAAPAQQPDALAFLAYAMGKEYEDLSRWHEAFDAYAREEGLGRVHAEGDPALPPERGLDGVRQRDVGYKSGLRQFRDQSRRWATASRRPGCADD